MSVRYNALIPSVLLGLGVVNLVLGVWLLGLTGTFNPSVLLGPLLAVVGLLQLSRTYFSYDRRRGVITTSALIGSVTRSYGGEGRLVVDGNRIVWHKADGRTKRVPVNRFYARGQQWEDVVGAIRTA